ncbi:hypothetical protein Lesp02_57640 [Lentzea sp. NBRC 105346]|uniref:P-loop NTPase fold protein n=1 Tax=Lentzea sp. NBRC 105346 TaxID=3032205 RepID=UPI0024A20B44|nr:P-loop NTPase fold protein [Lentzea sp. NBRC 105346]GLZ33576.1 hypothetical protein Lesp02_57640 [Lentzea sp. NBRC 105346]
MASANDGVWSMLAAPAKAALRWAFANALATADEGPDLVRVKAVDLLVGIMLADPADSELRRLFEHFHIPPGEVTGRVAAAHTLLSFYDTPLLTGMPPLETDVEALLGTATSEAVDTDGQVSLRALFGVLLGARISAVREALERRGVDYAAVVSTYREYLRGRQPYAEFLRDRLPYQAPRVELPHYFADQPRSRVDDAEDMVGIGTEVDAFAHLIASKRLIPPLAVGLFGDWGSGKSYFLRNLQRRIDGLAATAAPEAPFHRSIVQIEFNAWQYVGGDLWAGLVEHLFRNLRISGDDSDDLLAQRQRFWVEQVRGVSEEHQEALDEQLKLEQKKAAAEAQVAQREEEREQKVAELENARRARPLAGWKPSAELRKQITDSLGLTELSENGQALRDELGRAREDLQGLGAMLGPLRSGGPKYVAAVVLVIVLGPAIAYVSGKVDTSAIAAVAGTVGGLLTTLTGYLAIAGRYVRSATDKIAKAQAELAAAEQEQRDELDQKVQDAEEALAQAQKDLDAAKEREEGVAAKLAEVTESQAASTPRRVLTEFINERLGSDDYRRHLGVPALVRRDLERLSRLVAAQQDHTASEAVRDEYAIDRIVLYIDDLDRCPTPLVIKVLEAVHLLLAFPLFVVVVAVDARWLESSLREHYGQLGGADARPEDYLEKIFQVPFRLLPLDDEARDRMLRGLLTPSLRPSDATSTQTTGDIGQRFSEADLRAFHQVVDWLGEDERRPIAGADTVDLTVTAEEMTQIEDVAEFIGTTPRAVKRFINIYLLLRSIGTARGWKVPEQGQLVLLLALSVGVPRAFRQALEVGRLDKVGSDEPVFTRWLQAQPRRAAPHMDGLRDWTDLICRFHFTPR